MIFALGMVAGLVLGCLAPAVAGPWEQEEVQAVGIEPPGGMSLEALPQQGHNVDLLVTEMEYARDIHLLVTEIEYARDIHLRYLEAAEDPKTGNHAWHRRWVATYDEVIAVLEGCEP